MSDTPTPDADDAILAIVSQALDRQVKAFQEAGKNTAAEIRSINNRLTLLVVIGMVLQTSVVVGTLAVRTKFGDLEVTQWNRTVTAAHHAPIDAPGETLRIPPFIPEPTHTPSLFDDLMLPGSVEPLDAGPLTEPAPRPSPQPSPGPVPLPFALPLTHPVEP